MSHVCQKCGVIELNVSQKKVLYAVAFGELSSEIRKRLKVSASSATNRLNSLRRLGVLQREFRPQSSGGYESFWKPVVNLKVVFK